MASAASPTRSSCDRSRRLASALARAGVGKGDTVAIMAPNVPEMLEAHNGVPMLGAVLCPINFRLDAGSIAFILRHSEAKVLLADREFAAVIAQRACRARPASLLVVDIDDHAGARRRAPRRHGLRSVHRRAAIRHFPCGCRMTNGRRSR